MFLGMIKVPGKSPSIIHLSQSLDGSMKLECLRHDERGRKTGGRDKLESAAAMSTLRPVVRQAADTRGVDGGDYDAAWGSGR